MAKPASATESLFQSMMKRPSIAPARMGTMPEMGESLRTMPPTCWPRPPALSLPTGTTRSTPHGFAATLGDAKERRNRQGLGVLEIRPVGIPWS